MGFKIDITPVKSEVNEALRKIKLYDGKSRLRVEQAVEWGMDTVADQTEKRVPVKSGNLKKSISTKFKAEPLEAYVYARKPKGSHAHLVEMGAKALTIVTKQKANAGKRSPMAFAANGGMAFAHRVKIKARQPKPFMAPAFEATRPHIIRRLRKAVQP